MGVLGIGQSHRAQGSQQQTGDHHRRYHAPTASAQDSMFLSHCPLVARLR
jgi:hypothetical protein